MLRLRNLSLGSICWTLKIEEMTTDNMIYKFENATPKSSPVYTLPRGNRFSNYIQLTFFSNALRRSIDRIVYAWLYRQQEVVKLPIDRI